MKSTVSIAMLIMIQAMWSQAIQDDLSPDDILRAEYRTLQRREIDDSSFMVPGVSHRSRRRIVNLLPWKNIRVEPVMGIRWSTAGFEMDPLTIPSSVLWVSPGVKISASSYLFDPMLNLWLYAWGRFHKHSAYGFGGAQVVSDQTLFPYRPEFSVEYYGRTIKPDNGIDFDESLGGIALVSPKFNFIWGKFREHLGPSSRNNLHLSRNMPSFSHFRAVVFPVNGITLTYMLGQLDSMIPDSSLYRNIYEDHLDQTVKMPSVFRYLAMHRLDFTSAQKTFRIGIWEQVIFGGRTIPFEYLNPVNLFWSAQQKLGDVDNVQMGADWEIMFPNQRVYGALFIDEWAPFDTFKGSKEHNWAGWQAGSSRSFRAWSLEMMATLEYTFMDPRIAIHRFPINDPTHHGYYIGTWSGGHSDDWWVSVTVIPKDNLSGRIYWTTMRKGEQDRTAIYEDQSILWMEGEIRKRQVTGVEVWIWDSHQIRYTLGARWVKTRHLYGKDNFIDMTVGLLYNIHR